MTYYLLIHLYIFGFVYSVKYYNCMQLCDMHHFFGISLLHCASS